MGLGRDLKSLLWHLLGGTRGGKTRAKILLEISERPYNPNQISESLNLDYKTVTYHLEKLESEGLVTSNSEKYGEMYSFSEVLEENSEILEEIWEKLDNIGGS